LTETVLIADDNDLIRDAIRSYLQRADYEVLAGASVADALAVAVGHPGPVDVLITDLVMPDGDGFELATRLVERYPSLRVLFTSGYANMGWTGAFLAKPFTAAELAGALKGLVASRESWAPRSSGPD
jgi:CheY-like chemotaxis protein